MCIECVCVSSSPPSHTGFTLNTLLHSDGTGDATVLQTHRYTPHDELVHNANQADIIVVACGKPHLQELLI